MTVTEIVQMAANAITVAGVIIMLRWLFTFSRWTGKVDTRLTNLEGWMKAHTGKTWRR